LVDRREFRTTNYLKDIEGSEADSVKHTIRTDRCTNPLNPNYTSLDGGKIQFAGGRNQVRRMEEKKKEIEEVKNLP